MQPHVGGRDPTYRQVIGSILQGWCFLLLHGSEVHRLPSALLEGGHMYRPKPRRIPGYYVAPKLGWVIPREREETPGGGTREVSNSNEIHPSRALRHMRQLKSTASCTLEVSNGPCESLCLHGTLSIYASQSLPCRAFLSCAFLHVLAVLLDLLAMVASNTGWKLKDAKIIA